jgi:steroid delta-isomerase-like uncharacterized protein
LLVHLVKQKGIGAMATVTHDLKSIIRRLWEEGVNQQNWAVFDEILCEDYVGHDAGRAQGREELKAELAGYAAAFSDLRYTIEDMVAEGDRVVSRWTARGTHTGSLLNIPPTGKLVTVTGISIDRLVNGRVVEGWTEFDSLGMLQQLGALSLSGV